MSAAIVERPPTTEYAEPLARYVSRVPEADILETLAGQSDEWGTALGGIRGEGEHLRYAEGKWSIRQLAGHVVDSERIFAYRALCVARGETQPLPGFEEDEYVAGASFDECPLADLVQEFLHVRAAHVSFFGHLSPEAWQRIGTVNGHPLSVRAAAYVMVGHVRHHLAVLNERYLPRL